MIKFLKSELTNTSLEILEPGVCVYIDDKYKARIRIIIEEYKSENDMNDKYFQGVVNGLERALLEYQDMD